MAPFLKRILLPSQWIIRLSNLLGALFTILPILFVLLIGITLVGGIVPGFAPLVTAAWVVAIAASLGVAIHRTFRNTTADRIARQIDYEMDLKDRVASAFEFTGKTSPTPFMETQIRDTEALVGRLDKPPVLPFRMPPNTRRFLVFLTTVVLFAGVIDHLKSLPVPVHTYYKEVPALSQEEENLLKEFKSQLTPTEQVIFESTIEPAYRQFMSKRMPPRKDKIPEAPQVPPRSAQAEAQKAQGAALEGIDIAEGQGFSAGFEADEQKVRNLVPADILDIFSSTGLPMIRGSFMRSGPGNRGQSIRAGGGAMVKGGGTIKGAAARAAPIQKSFLNFLQGPRPDIYEEQEQEAVLRSFAEYMNLLTASLGEQWMAEHMDPDQEKPGRGPSVQVDIPDSLKKMLQSEDEDASEYSEHVKSRFEELDLPFDHENLEKMKLVYGKRSTTPSFHIDATGAGTQVGASGGGSGKSIGSASDLASLDDGKGDLLPIEGKVGEGQVIVKVIDDISQYDFKPNALIAYSDLFGDYSKLALEVLDQEVIPQELKRYIKEYFETIRPGAGTETGEE